MGMTQNFLFLKYSLFLDTHIVHIQYIITPPYSSFHITSQFLGNFTHVSGNVWVCNLTIPHIPTELKHLGFFDRFPQMQKAILDILCSILRLDSESRYFSLPSPSTLHVVLSTLALIMVLILVITY